jgi:hypothetical protein
VAVVKAENGAEGGYGAAAVGTAQTCGVTLKVRGGGGGGEVKIMKVQVVVMATSKE